MQWERYLGRLFGPLIKTGVPLMNNVLTRLAKRVLIQLQLTAAALAEDAGNQKNKILSSRKTTLTILKKEIIGIMKIVKSSEEFDLLIKGVTKTI